MSSPSTKTHTFPSVFSTQFDKNIIPDQAVQSPVLHQCKIVGIEHTAFSIYWQTLPNQDHK
jgi:hypothetical protein